MSAQDEAQYENLLSVVRDEFSNFRDLGGLPARDGRELRQGVVFRTQALVDPTPEVQDALVALQLSTVVDLRMDHERAELPIELPESISIVIANVAADLADKNAATAAGAAAAPRKVDKNAYVPHANMTGGYDMMIDAYRKFVEIDSAKRGYAQMLRSIIQTDGAVAIFCAAGKDRTGWGSALIQSIAGVSDSIIVESYLQTNQNLISRYANAIEEVRNSGGDEEAFMALVSSHADYLASAFDTVNSQFGGLEGYVLQGLGLTPAELSELEGKLLAEV